MTTVTSIWLLATILLPLLSALWIRGLHDPDRARRHSLIVCTVTLFLACGAWWGFASTLGVEGDSADDAGNRLFGGPLFAIDALSAPLLALAALLFLLTVLATLRTKMRRTSFVSVLFSESIVLGTLASLHPWVIIALLALGTLPPWVELRSLGKPRRVYVLHMGLFVALLVSGQLLLDHSPAESLAATVAIALLMAAALVRSGIVPLHCWLSDLFQQATFATALLFVTPMVGAYAAIRLVLPIAPAWMLQSMAIVSLVTALYAAGMALVQMEARRFFCYLFLSHSALVFVGLETLTPLGLTAALCVWLSVAISMTGFGLSMRTVEARMGHLSLNEFHGLYEHTPGLAAFFLLTGLASVGFPGTVGFVGAELLVDGVVQAYPAVGIAIVIASALNGLAVLQAYFRIFTGTVHHSSVDLGIRLPERIAVLILTALILGGGLYPQLGIASRYGAAMQLVQSREQHADALAKAQSPAALPPKAPSVPSPEPLAEKQPALPDWR